MTEVEDRIISQSTDGIILETILDEYITDGVGSFTTEMQIMAQTLSIWMRMGG